MMNVFTDTETEQHINSLIGKRLRLFRKHQKVSMQKLSKHLGISYQQLQKYETGQNKLRLDYILKIADFFKQPRMVFISDILEEDFLSLSQNKKNTKNFDSEAYEMMILFSEIKNKKIKKDLKNLIKIMVESNQ